MVVFAPQIYTVITPRELSSAEKKALTASGASNETQTLCYLSKWLIVRYTVLLRCLHNAEHLRNIMSWHNM